MFKVEMLLYARVMIKLPRVHSEGLGLAVHVFSLAAGRIRVISVIGWGRADVVSWGCHGAERQAGSSLVYDPEINLGQYFVLRTTLIIGNLIRASRAQTLFSGNSHVLT